MKRLILFVFVFLVCLGSAFAVTDYVDIRFDATTVDTSGLAGRLSGNYYAQAQSFYLNEGGTVNNVTIRIGTQSGSARNFYVQITDSLTALESASLCNSNNVLLNSVGNFNFNFDNCPELNSSQDYWLRLMRNDTFATNDYVNVYTKGGTDYNGTSYFETRSESGTDIYSFTQSNTAIDMSSRIYYQTGQLNFDTIEVNNETLTDPFYINSQELNFSTIVTYQINPNINQTYFLYQNGTLNQTSQFATNNQNGSFTLNLDEGQYQIYFYADNGDVNDTTINYTINVDITPPTINNTLPSEINTYDLGNVSNYVTCEDIGNGTCTINFTTDGNVINNTKNYTFTYNGNQSYIITATDDAGNTAIENGTLLVNPRIFFSFNDTGTGSLVQNYTFGGRSDVSGYVNSTIYNDLLTIGENSLEFDKLNYVLQNFTFNITNTTTANFTFNVTPATININLYDRTTGNLITDLVELVLVGDVGANTSTTNGTATFQTIDGEEGDYQIIATSDFFQTEQRYFTYTNQENLTIDFYMTNSTGFVTVSVKDSLSFFVESAIVNLLEWKPSLSAYQSVAQCRTNINGECDLNIELGTKLYKFQASKNGVVQTTSSQIIETTGETINMVLDAGETRDVPDLAGLSFNLNETISGNISTARFQFADSNGVVTQACIEFYKVTQYRLTFINKTCVSSNSGILFKSQNVNNTYKTEIWATVNADGSKYTLDKLIHEGTEDLGVTLEINNLDIYVPMVLLLLAIATGLFFANIYVSAMLVIVSQWLAFVIVPSVLSSGIATVVTVLSILLMWGASKR